MADTEFLTIMENLRKIAEGPMVLSNQIYDPEKKMDQIRQGKYFVLMQGERGVRMFTDLIQAMNHGGNGGSDLYVECYNSDGMKCGELASVTSSNPAPEGFLWTTHF